MLPVAVIVGLATGITTAIATSMIATDRDSRPNAAAAPADSSRELAELRGAIDALRAEVAQLQSTPAAASPGSAPGPLGPTASASRADIAALTEEVHALATRIEPLLPARLDLPLQPDLEKRKALAPFLGKKAVSPDQYLYWTESQLLDAYGPPNQIMDWSSNPAWLYYGLEDPGQIGETVMFTFIGGRVTGFRKD